AALRRGPSERAPAPAPARPEQAPAPAGGRIGAALLIVALVALGLRPTLVTGRVAPAAAAWMGQVHARWCRDLVAPAERPTLDPAPAGCEAPIPAVRARLRAAEASP